MEMCGKHDQGANPALIELLSQSLSQRTGIFMWTILLTELKH